MEVQETHISGVVVLLPTRHSDSRGFLAEVYNDRTLEKAGITDVFVQGNHIYSKMAGTIEESFQAEPAETSKLVGVTRASAYDVAVDLRHEALRSGLLWLWS